MKYITLTLLLFLSLGYASAQMFTFTFEGIERSYKVHLPPDYDPDSLYPLVFNLHGYGSNAIEQQLYSGFDFVADTAGVVMVYPNGVDNQWTVYGSTGPNDVGFISALIDTMSTHYSIDLDRIYSTGMSMGGFMSYRLACELENRIAAIASVAGLLVTNPCEPSRPVAILQIHGTADPTVPYTLVPTTVDFWTGYNGCPPDPVITDLPDIDTTDQSTVTVSYYGPCEDSTEVILYTINGGEHTWPGAIINIGITNQDINASVEIWNFFKKYSIEGHVGISEKPVLNFGLSCYPNPFHQATTLELTGPYSSDYLVRLYDINGSKVLEKNYSEGKRMLLLRGDLAAGVYFLEVTARGYRGTSKVVIR